MQVHFLGLQRPFGAVAHSPQGPEDQNENINHRDSAKRFQAFLAECFFQIAKASRRDVNHLPSATPEEQSSDDHRYAGNSKRPTWSPPRIRKKPGTKERRNEGTSVNREIEPTKHFRQQMLVGVAELIADVGGNARFDSAYS